MAVGAAVAVAAGGSVGTGGWVGATVGSIVGAGSVAVGSGGLAVGAGVAVPHACKTKQSNKITPVHFVDRILISSSFFHGNGIQETVISQDNEYKLTLYCRKDYNEDFNSQVYNRLTLPRMAY